MKAFPVETGPVETGPVEGALTAGLEQAVNNEISKNPTRIVRVCIRYLQVAPYEHSAGEVGMRYR